MGRGQQLRRCCLFVGTGRLDRAIPVRPLVRARPPIYAVGL